MPRAIRRTAPTIDVSPPSVEDVYLEIRALVQRSLDRLHVEEQKLSDVLQQLGAPPAPNGESPTPAHTRSPKPKTRTMSAAARKRVSERMKAFWAEKRKHEK